MPDEEPRPVAARRPIPHLRWWIGGLLFLSTVINYIDRQTLSVLAPYLKVDYRWSNEDFALVVISFRLAYTIGQTLSGRFIDCVGTRRGLSISVTWYSIAAMLTSLATGLRSFCFFRFLLGAGESANWPAATKAVAEWFPKHERGWAVALFDSGSSVGGAIAPFLVLWLYRNFGGWQPAFIIVGTLGFIWLMAWRWLYYPPERHPRLGADERAMIAGDKRAESEARMNGASAGMNPAGPIERNLAWSELLKLPRTWGVIFARSLTDPVWFFIADWLAIYLVAKGVKLESALIALWIPFLAADLGNFSGGGISSWLIRRGWPVLRARKMVFVAGCAGVLCLIPTIYTANVYALAAFIGIATFTYAAASTMALVLPSDLYSSASVATVSGMSGTGAGMGTLLSTYLTGYISDRYSFGPIMLVASCVPLVGAVLVLLLVRETKRTTM